MEPITTILVAPTADRKTAASGFGDTLRAVAAGAADGIAAASAIAGPLAPVGMVLAGAVRGAALSAPAARPPPSGGATGSSAGAGTPAASAGGDAFEAARVLQQEGQSFNLRYLELQERMQRETRELTALSNVMKVRHDAARAAIQNVQ
jgi:hypothetical protein